MRRLAATALAAFSFAGLALWPTAAEAHSLESSTISTHVNSDGTVDATISIALETLDEALGTEYAAGTDVTSYADAVNAYLADHLSVTDATGTSSSSPSTTPRSSPSRASRRTASTSRSTRAPPTFRR